MRDVIDLDRAPSCRPAAEGDHPCRPTGGTDM